MAGPSFCHRHAPRRRSQEFASSINSAEGAAIDLTKPFLLDGLDGTGNAAMLGEDTIVFSGTWENVRTVLDVAAGRSPSLVEWPDVAALLGAGPAPLATAILVDGVIFAEPPPVPPEELLGPDVQRAEREAQEALAAELGPMPLPRLALLGLTPGGPLPSAYRAGNATRSTLAPGQLRAAYELALLFDDPAAADAAAAIVARRLTFLHVVLVAEHIFGERTLTHSELFPRAEFRTTAASAVLRMRLEPVNYVLHAPTHLLNTGELRFLWP